MLSVLTDNWDLFKEGFWTTIRLFLVSGVLSLVFGTLLAAFRVSPIPALRVHGHRPWLTTSDYLSLLTETALVSYALTPAWSGVSIRHPPARLTTPSAT